MEIKSLSPKYIFKKTFALTKDIYRQLLSFCIPAFLLIALGIYKLNPLLALIGLLAFLYLTLASALYILGKVNGYSKSSYEILVESRNLFPKVLLWIILLSLILAPAFIALIIPGMYLSCRLIFSFFLIAEENFPIVESLRRSWNITKNNLSPLIQNGLSIFFFYSFLIFLSIINSGNLGKQIPLFLLIFMSPFLLVYSTLVYKGLTSFESRISSSANTLKKLEIENIRVEFNGSLDAKDFSKAMWTMQSRIVWTAVIPLTALGVTTLLPIITSPEGITLEIITRIISTLIIPTLLLILLFIILRRSPRRIFKSHKALNSQVSGYVREKDLKWNSQYTKTEFSWEAFVSYRDLQDLVMLYVANSQALILPKRFFETEDDWENFKLIVASKIPKKLG